MVVGVFVVEIFIIGCYCFGVMVRREDDSGGCVVVDMVVWSWRLFMNMAAHDNGGSVHRVVLV